MIKIIELKFEDGEIWQIPLSFVAKHRADYYKKRSEEIGIETIEVLNEAEEKFNYTMTDDYAAEDWLKNNMDYEDFKSVVNIIPAKPQIKDWINADTCIKEI